MVLFYWIILAPSKGNIVRLNIDEISIIANMNAESMGFRCPKGGCKVKADGPKGGASVP